MYHTAAYVIDVTKINYYISTHLPINPFTGIPNKGNISDQGSFFDHETNKVTRLHLARMLTVLNSFSPASVLNCLAVPEELSKLLSCLFGWSLGIHIEVCEGKRNLSGWRMLNIHFISYSSK